MGSRFYFPDLQAFRSPMGISSSAHPGQVYYIPSISHLLPSQSPAGISSLYGFKGVRHEATRARLKSPALILQRLPGSLCQNNKGET
jgi:hypothetical protein